MIVVKSITDVRTAIAQARLAGKTVGFVPTMGALHEGHYSLVDAARSECDFVAVSIFVNPTQFAPGEDLDSYPRTLQADLDGCEHRGVDLVFVPDEAEMYPDGRGGGLTTVSVAKLPETLCGQSRPTHFAGVCTVVTKLFNIVQPDKAYFGQKDYQQVTILRRMVSDLNQPVEVVTCPIVREESGLAMSSRNEYLDPEIRTTQAAALYSALLWGRKVVEMHRPPIHEIREGMERVLAVEAPDFALEYLRFVDPDTLEDLGDTYGRMVIALAGRFGQIRLIDNCLVE